MAFKNRVRLPIDFNRPQFPAEITAFRNAAGMTKTLSAVIRKTYQGVTDWLPERDHERIRIALLHDHVWVECSRYVGLLAMTEADYSISWSDDFKQFPIAPAAFAMDVTPYAFSNSNCMTCDEVKSVVLTDDVFPSNLTEGQNASINVLTNDNVCCYPVVLEIVTYDSTLISNPVLSVEGVLTFTVKTGLKSINKANLLTYSATCSSGYQDTADVFANITGTQPSCLAPLGLALQQLGATEVKVLIQPPAPRPNHFEWYLVRVSDGAEVRRGDESSNTITLITIADTDYKLFVRSQCGTVDNSLTASNYIEFDFSTPVDSRSCGKYNVYASNFGQDADANAYVTVLYTDCNGAGQGLRIKNYTQSQISALQTSAGVPVNIAKSGMPGDGWTIKITYVP